MKKVFLIFFILPAYLYGDTVSIGRFIRSYGRIERSSINCPYGVCADSSVDISAGDRVKTFKNSEARILLNDGTSIDIKGAADFTIFSIRKHAADPPTRIYADYGTFTIIQKNNFMDSSLFIGTRAALIKSVDASMYIIASIDETAVMVYRNRAGVASSLPPVDTAFILKEGDEIFIKIDQPPAEPANVKPLLRGSWLTKNFLSPDLRAIIRSKQDSTIIDWLFRNRN